MAKRRRDDIGNIKIGSAGDHCRRPAGITAHVTKIITGHRELCGTVSSFERDDDLIGEATQYYVTPDVMSGEPFVARHDGAAPETRTATKPALAVPIAAFEDRFAVVVEMPDGTKGELLRQDGAIRATTMWWFMEARPRRFATVSQTQDRRWAAATSDDAGERNDHGAKTEEVRRRRGGDHELGIKKKVST